MDLVLRELEKWIKQAPVFRTPSQAMDRMMRLIGSRVRTIYGRIGLPPDTSYPLIFAHNAPEFVRILELLLSRGLILLHNRTDGDVELTLQGWDRLDELQRTDPDSDQAFVAMWFSENVGDAFLAGFRPALRAVGYRPFRVDLKAHNRKIDDEIIAEIRRSGLLVADFTGHRTGVYYEAGFAEGLGIPVIRTCRKGALDDLHFDIRQYFTIEWEKSSDLSVKLERHIRATIAGRALRGPLPSLGDDDEAMGE